MYVVTGSFDQMSPEMTSNTTPTPFVALASSVYNPGPYDAYNAFNTNTQTIWHSTAGDVVGAWLQLNFGEAVKLGGIMLHPSPTQWIGLMAKSFSVQVSNDGTDWTVVKYVDSLASNIEEKWYTVYFDDVVVCKYIKIVVHQVFNPSGNYTSLSSVQFLISDVSLDRKTIMFRGEEILGGGVSMNQVNAAIDEKLKNVQTEEVYSTEETRIGTWIDGEPLYRKVISGKVPAVSANWTPVGDPIENIKDVVSMTGAHAAAAYAVSVWVGIPNSNINVGIDISNKPLFLNQEVQAYVGYPFFVKIEYTKTTDTAPTTVSEKSNANSIQAPATVQNLQSTAVTAGCIIKEVDHA